MKVRILAALMIFSLISSCVTEKKARRWAYEHKEKLAEWCADCFPVKPVEIKPGRPIVLKGDTVVTIDTVKVQADCPDGTKVDCPPNVIKTITDTLYIRDTIMIRDMAQEEVLNQQIKGKEESLSKMENARDSWRRWFLWSLAINLLFAVIVWLRR